MLGTRVRHAGGVGQVTGVGKVGITVDGKHKLPHGEYQPHDEAHDLPALATAYARWRQRLPQHLAQGPRSKMGVTAARAVLLDQHIAGRDDLEPEVKQRLQAVLGTLKAGAAKVKGATDMFVAGGKQIGDSDVETYLDDFGLSRRGLEAYHTNRAVHDAHREHGDLGKAQKEGVARVRASGAEQLVDPRLGPALEAKSQGGEPAHADAHRRFAAFAKGMGAAGGEDGQEEELAKARRPTQAELEAAGQVSMFGAPRPAAAPAAHAALTPKRVTVAAHTTSLGVHVPQHQTTVYVRPEDPHPQPPPAAAAPPQPVVNEPEPPPEPPAPPVVAAATAPELPHERDGLRSDRDVSTWDVPPHKLPALRTHLAALTKKALRLGIQPPTLEVLGDPRLKTFTITEVDPFDGVTRSRDVAREVVPVKITGPVIKAPGWNVIGMFEPTPGGNLLTSFGGAELPAHLHAADAKCEHCNTVRDRKRIFVMAEQGTGKLKKIGGSCVEEFTGLNPHAVAGAAAFMQDFYNGAEGDLEQFGAGGDPPLDTIDVLTAASYSFLKFGFIRSWDSGATVQHVRDIFSRQKGIDRPTADARIRARAHADKVLAWMREIPSNTDSSYLRNLRTLAELPQIPHERSIGLLASAPHAYEQAMGEARRRETETFFGKVGDKIGPLTAADKKKGAASHPPVHVRLASKRVLDTNYGPQTILRFEDEAGGHTFVWKTGADKVFDWKTDSDFGLPFEVGIGYVLSKATIEEHNSYRGAKETRIVRPKIHVDISPAERDAVDAAGAEHVAHMESQSAYGTTDPTWRERADLRERQDAIRAHMTARVLGDDAGARAHLEDLREYHRDSTAERTDSGHIYVPTTLADLPRVAREGLAGNVGRLPRLPPAATFKEGRVLVAKTPRAAREMTVAASLEQPSAFSTEAEHRAATQVMLRAKHESDTVVHDTSHGVKYGAVDHVAPEHLEFWAPGEGWRPVSEHDPAVHTHHPDLVSSHFPDRSDTGRHIYPESDIPQAEGTRPKRGHQVGYRPPSNTDYHAPRADQELAKMATTTRFIMRLRITRTADELLKSAPPPVELAEETRENGTVVQAVLRCSGRSWSYRTLAKGGAYLRCADGLPMPLHVICRDLRDAEAVVRHSTVAIGAGKAPPRGVIRLDELVKSQLSLFGGLAPKQVTVAAHTTSLGVHVPQHQTTVYVRPNEPAPTVAPATENAIGPHAASRKELHEAIATRAVAIVRENMRREYDRIGEPMLNDAQVADRAWSLTHFGTSAREARHSHEAIREAIQRAKKMPGDGDPSDEMFAAIHAAAARKVKAAPAKATRMSAVTYSAPERNGAEFAEYAKTVLRAVAGHLMDQTVASERQPSTWDERESRADRLSRNYSALPDAEQGEMKRAMLHLREVMRSGTVPPSDFRAALRAEATRRHLAEVDARSRAR